MSDNDDSELIFDKRTTNAAFQQRLLEAQQEIKDDLEDQLDLEEFDVNKTQKELQKEFEQLQAHVARNNKKIHTLKNRLKKRQLKRQIEQSLSNLTPAERAQRLEEELKHLEENAGVEREEPEMDILFEYILFLSTDSSAGDLSKADFLHEHNEVREKALKDEKVLRESEIMNLRFDEVSNVSKHDLKDDTITRECQLSGVSSEKPFVVSFNVTEPSKTISNLSFDVGIEMQLDVGTLLDFIKEECDLLAFFRTLIHYSKLELQRKNTIKRWEKNYENESIMVEVLSNTKIKFQDEGNSDVFLLLEWKIIEKNVVENSLDADLVENVMPVFALEAVTNPEKENASSDDMTPYLTPMIPEHGVFTSVNTFITGILK